LQGSPRPELGGLRTKELKTENRKQKTENRKQKTENRKQKTENRKQKTENIIHPYKIKSSAFSTCKNSLYLGCFYKLS